MNKNDANALLSKLVASGVADAFLEVISNSNRVYELCCNAVEDHLSLGDSPRLYSDMSVACFTKEMMCYPWDKCGLRALRHSRGAYDRVELSSNNIQIIVSKEGDYKAEYKKACIRLNDATGADGARGAVLCYTSDERKRIVAARLVMLNSNMNELASASVFPASNAPQVLVG